MIALENNQMKTVLEKAWIYIYTVPILEAPAAAFGRMPASTHTRA